jgi:hypothetical protein
MDAGKILYKLTYAEDLPTEGRAAPNLKCEQNTEIVFCYCWINEESAGL